MTLRDWTSRYRKTVDTAADLTAQNPEVIRDEMQFECLDVSWKTPLGDRSKESTG